MLKLKLQLFAETYGDFASQNEAHAYFDRELKEAVYETRKLNKFITEKKLPKNHGKSYTFSKWNPYVVTLNALTEGVVPTEDAPMTREEFTMRLSDFGGYQTYTDQVDLYDVSNGVADRLIRNQGGALGEAFDKRDYKIMLSSPNRWYAGVTYNPSTHTDLTTLRNALTNFKLGDLPKIRAFLKRAKVRTINGYYVVLCSPEVVADILTLSKSGASDEYTFVEVAKYNNTKPVFEGEVGTFMGFRIVESEAVGIIEGTTNVHGCVILGLRDGEYGVQAISLEGEGAPKVIVKALGSAGTNDPIDQKGSVGWKMAGYGSMVLYAEAVLVYECKSGIAVGSEFDETGREAHVGSFGAGKGGYAEPTKAEYINGTKKA